MMFCTFRMLGIYQPVLEAGLSSAPLEARGLAKIFKHFRLRAKVGSNPRILDVSCGIGRHSINLARLGYEVVGFDFSPYFLRTARRLARQEGLGRHRVRFYEGDTTQIQEILEENGEVDFDAIICMDTSITRPTIGEEIDLLRSMYKLGSERSLLVIETANRDSFLKNRKCYTLPMVQSFPRRLQRHIQVEYNPENMHMKGEWKFYKRAEQWRLEASTFYQIRVKYPFTKGLANCFGERRLGISPQLWEYPTTQQA